MQRLIAFAIALLSVQLVIGEWNKLLSEFLESRKASSLAREY